MSAIRKELAQLDWEKKQKDEEAASFIASVYREYLIKKHDRICEKLKEAIRNNVSVEINFDSAFYTIKGCWQNLWGLCITPPDDWKRFSNSHESLTKILYSLYDESIADLLECVNYNIRIQPVYSYKGIYLYSELLLCLKYKSSK